MSDQRGAVLPLLMGALVAISILMFVVGQAIFTQRHTVRRAEQAERAYYVAEAGIEAALGDIAAGRAPRDFSVDGVRAEVAVTRPGGEIEIVSTGMAGDSSVTIRARIVRRSGQLIVTSWNRGPAPK